MKTFAFALLLAGLAPGPACAEPEIKAQDTQAEEAAAVRDRLATSLFFRGELADKIMAAGQEATFVDTEGMETHAEVRGALLGWIRRNPDKAAQAWLHLKTGATSFPDKIELTEMTWKFNEGFIGMIKALSDAAGDRNVSSEELELASRRLYEGPQAEAAGPVVVSGVGAGAAAGGGAGQPLNYADYKLNKAGLDKELAAAGAWLASARSAGAAGRKFYGGAMAEYSAFLVAASALKGRSAITSEESRSLEARRRSLRGRLSALAMDERAYDLGKMAAVLRARGAANMAALAEAMAARFANTAARLAEEGAGPDQLSAMAAAAEKDFSAFYLRYSVYNSIAGLRALAAPRGFSCFYDYAAWRYLAAFYPGAAYPKARAALAGALPVLEEALARADAGDFESAVGAAAPRAAELKAAAALADSVSAFNRKAQFLLWGVLFRPAELRVRRSGGKNSFLPSATFFEVMRR